MQETKEHKPKAVHRAEVASHIPGRLRVRLQRESRHPHILNRIKEKLEEQPGVHAVEVNHAAGSVTVKYDHQLHVGTGILGLLEDFDVLVGTVMDVPRIGGAAGSEGAGVVTLADALNDLNSRISALTGISLDLKVLFPVALAGTGLWLIAVNGLMIETMPGWLLVWFAFDAYLKLNPHGVAAEQLPIPIV
jgi:hypothetical protein